MTSSCCCYKRGGKLILITHTHTTMDIGPDEKYLPANPLNMAMANFKSRLETFINWPSNHIVSSTQLAKAGFYFLHRDDRVQCAFCLGTLHNWKEGDTAMGEHHRHFPHCLYVQASKDKCKSCLSATPNMVFFPCLHLVCCEDCSLDYCTVCKMNIQSKLKVNRGNCTCQAFDCAICN